MPYLSITTNQSIAEGPLQQLLRSASALIAEQLGKPERFVMVDWRHNPHMLFAGDHGPLAYLELKSIGLPGDATVDLSAALSTLIRQHLGVVPERVYVEFADAQRHMWGWKGGTF